MAIPDWASRRHSGQRGLSSHSGSLGVHQGGQVLSRPSSSGTLGRGLSGADLAAAGALSGGSMAVGSAPRKMF
jgi:hypothetical protein